MVDVWCDKVGPSFFEVWCEVCQEFCGCVSTFASGYCGTTEFVVIKRFDCGDCGTGIEVPGRLALMDNSHE